MFSQNLVKVPQKIIKTPRLRNDSEVKISKSVVEIPITDDKIPDIRFEITMNGGQIFKAPFQIPMYAVIIPETRVEILIYGVK